jgi:hypothetical protein
MVNFAKALSSHKTKKTKTRSCKLKWLAQYTVMADLKIEDVPEEQVTCLCHIATAIESDQALTNPQIGLKGGLLPFEFYKALSGALPLNKTALLEQLILSCVRVPTGGCEALVWGLCYQLYHLEAGDKSIS